MCPASQTEEAYQARLTKNKGYQERLANNKLREGEVGLLRYCPDEWDMKYCGTQRRNEWSQATDLLDLLLADETVAARASVDRAFETMIQVLAELDAEEFFGRGEGREAITLMIWITDSSLAEDWWAKSVKQLNPARVYEDSSARYPRIIEVRDCRTWLAADPAVAPRLGPHSGFARHHAVAAATAGEL